ncbi:MAG: hypothetical protein ACFB4J_18520 [Elainellaceae cyanobacterium]
MRRFVFISALTAVGVLGQSLVSPIALAGAFNPSGFINPRGAISADDYGDCARDLLESGIDAAEAVDVCASAFDPDEVADCVEDIQDDTAVAANDALGACLRVRRPDELADCVVDVDKAFDQQFSDDALAYCTRSLLPARFADCVIGIHDDAQAAAISIMDACVEGDYSIEALFIPGIGTSEITAPAEIPEELDKLEP